jgi:hypothetical protein
LVTVATSRKSRIDCRIVGTAALERTSREAGFESAAELREVLERLFAAVEADERVGPLLRAAHVRARLQFTDRHLVLNLASSEDEDSYLDWNFSARPPWTPKVTLRMDSSVANAWLQGKESLAIAIARGRVKCVGESRSTLFFVPVAKLLTEPYRRVIDSGYEHLRLP